MILYLVRHALAEDREKFFARICQEPKQDHLRELTPKGRKKLQKLVAGLKSREVMDPDLIVASPYLRAKQTAQIFADFFPSAKIEESLELVPQAPAIAFVKWLKSHGREFEEVVVVGHEPHISLLGSHLLAGSMKSTEDRVPNFIEFKKGAIMCIEADSGSEFMGGHCWLKWFLSPKICE